MHRADLLAMFVDRLPPERVHTGHRCIGFEQDADEATVTFANGARVTADVVIGADGIHSVLQQYVVAPSPPLFSGSVAHRGLITAASVGWPAGRCATGWARASISWSFPCAPTSSSTTSAS